MIEEFLIFTSIFSICDLILIIIIATQMQKKVDKNNFAQFIEKYDIIVDNKIKNIYHLTKKNKKEKRKK